MVLHLAQSLQHTVARESPRLRSVTESEASARPARENAWSRKEEPGHLIDSAANNHVRFVRASLDGEFRGPEYEQNGWVRMHGYGEMPWLELVDFRERSNALLARVIVRIPEDRTTSPCVIGTGAPVTLRFVVEDYIRRLRRHLDRIPTSE